MKKLIFGSVIFIGGVLGIIGSLISYAIVAASRDQSIAIFLQESTDGTGSFLFVFAFLSLVGLIVGIVDVVSKNKSKT